jgi:hypothetical protein
MSKPVKVVLNCSTVGALPSEQAEELAGQLEQSAMDILRQADPQQPGAVELAAAKASALVRAANETRNGAETAVEQIVPLDDDEIAQRAVDQADAEKQAAADATAADARTTLATKLAKGAATDAEVQQALAQLLS